MRDININQVKVGIIKDESGIYRPDTPFDRLLDCRSSFVGNELLRKAAEADECGSFDEASVAPFATSNTIATVKMLTPKGNVWISTADYAAFIDGCNDCCVGS